MTEQTENHKPLLITFWVLVALILCLVVGNVIVVVTRSRKSEVITIADDDFTEDIANETMLRDEVQTISDRINALLRMDPVNFEAISSLVNSGIEKAASVGRLDYVIPLLNNRTNILVENGYEREALDALMASADAINELEASDRHRMYMKAYALAGKLDDERAMAMYKNLMNETEEAYQTDYNGVQKSVDDDSEMKGADNA